MSPTCAVAKMFSMRDRKRECRSSSCKLPLGAKHLRALACWRASFAAVVTIDLLEHKRERERTPSLTKTIHSLSPLPQRLPQSESLRTACLDYGNALSLVRDNALHNHSLATQYTEALNLDMQCSANWRFMLRVVEQ